MSDLVRELSSIAVVVCVAWVITTLIKATSGKYGR
jgi:hypothetical protein